MTERKREERKIIPVLDKGYVELVDWLGTDNRVVAAARVSYGNETKGEEADKRLIRYLLKHGHMSPFEQVIFTFRIKAPIFVFRQLFRYRTAKINEISGRYVEMSDEFYIPSVWRKPHPENRQASRAEFESKSLDYLYQTQLNSIYGVYKEMLALGAPKEMARMVLPLATYSQAFFCLDLRNLFNVFQQRIHEGAQVETEQYAKALRALITPLVPWTMEVWKDLNDAKATL